MAKPSSWSANQAGVDPAWQWAWDDLVAALPLWEGSGTTVHEYIGNTDSTLQGGAAWETMTDGDGAVRFTATGEYVNVPIGVSPTTFTIIAVVEIVGTNLADETNIVTMSNDGGNSPSEYSGGLFIQTTGALRAYGYDGTQRFANGSTVLSTGTTYVLGITWNEAGGLKGWVDGVNDGTVATVDAHYTSWSSGPVLHLGGATSDTTSAPNHRIAAVSMWDVRLTDEQIEDIAADPWGMYTQAAGGGGGLQPFGLHQIMNGAR